MMTTSISSKGDDGHPRLERVNLKPKCLRYAFLYLLVLDVAVNIGDNADG